jgi:hypothetical protein
MDCHCSLAPHDWLTVCLGKLLLVLPAQSFLTLSPMVLMSIFYCLTTGCCWSSLNSISMDHIENTASSIAASTSTANEMCLQCHCLANDCLHSFNYSGIQPSCHNMLYECKFCIRSWMSKQRLLQCTVLIFWSGYVYYSIKVTVCNQLFVHIIHGRWC